MNNLIWKLIVIVFILMLFGCASYVFAPPYYPEDYWKKKGYSNDMIKVVDSGCGTNASKNSLCMLERGFIFADPNATCGESRNKDYLPCKYKKEIFPVNKKVQDCYETGEFIAKRTCNGVPIDAKLLDIKHSDTYDEIDDDFDRSIEIRNKTQNTNNHQMNSLLKK